MAVNRYYAVKNSYTIPAQIVGNAGALRVGRGIDMLNPDEPTMVPETTPFFMQRALLQEAKDESHYEISGDAVKDTFSILQTESIAQEALVLNTHFRASYTISSLDAAASMARSESRSSVSAYILLKHVGETRSLSDTPVAVNPHLDPLAEHLKDEEESFAQFRRDFGTHYIETVTYGLTIAIRGRASKTDSGLRQEIGVNLSSGFGALKVGANIDVNVQKFLQDNKIQISCEISGGGIIPARALILQGFDRITAFLKDITEGTIRFRLAPVELTLFSYWHLLDPKKLPRCRRMLDPHQDTKIYAPTSAFGIPAGTVVAWRPPRNAVKGEGANAVIVPPPGWALCDGTNNTPDLRDRFIRSTSDFSSLDRTGGKASHTHKKILGDVAKKAGLVTETRTAMIGIEEESDLLPPYATLVHIMKLDENP